MKKYKYNINNLDCANCAKKIEDSLKKEKDFKNVVVNFSTSKLIFEAEEKVLLSDINKKIKKIEPEVYLSEKIESNQKEYYLSIFIFALVLGISGIIINSNILLKYTLLSISYILLLYKTFTKACKLFIKNKTLNENALITISCIGAFLVGASSEGIMVIALYTIGKILEEKAINNSRNSIKGLIDLKQNFSNKKENEKIVNIKVEDIKVGDILIVKKGEKIPVDGILISKEAKLDTSALTGESESVCLKRKEKVLSGFINIGEVIEIKATTLFENSTVSKILELVEEATDKKTKTETLVSKITKVYTPIVLVLSVLISVFLPIFTSINYFESIYRGLTFLVISCPCAIAISVPLSYFTGIGIASKNGILIKGSNFLDNLTHINKIIFDKTGTLTNGSFEITKIEIFDKKYSENDIIDIILKGESLSNHPIAKSFLKLTDKKITNIDVKDFKEHEGKGISYKIGENKITIGNSKTCDCENIASLHLNINEKHVASIMIDDGIKKNAKTVISELKNNSIIPYMFTGDKKDIASKISNKLNIDNFEYEMLPTNKYEKYEEIKKQNEIVAFVGDGINDAPVLKRADIGLSMGNVGSAAAIEASDIVIMNDDLEKILKAIKISKFTNYIIKQNLIFALSIKALILLTSVFGFTNMWFAVFADTGLTLMTILNSLRIMKKFK